MIIHCKECGAMFQPRKNPCQHCIEQVATHLWAARDLLVALGMTSYAEMVMDAIRHVNKDLKPEIHNSPSGNKEA